MTTTTTTRRRCTQMTAPQAVEILKNNKFGNNHPTDRPSRIPEALNSSDSNTHHRACRKLGRQSNTRQPPVGRAKMIETIVIRGIFFF